MSFFANGAFPSTQICGRATRADRAGQFGEHQVVEYGDHPCFGVAQAMNLALGEDWVGSHATKPRASSHAHASDKARSASRPGAVPDCCDSLM